MSIKDFETKEEYLFTTDLSKKQNPEFEEDKTYTISEAGRNKSPVKDKLKVFFVQAVKTKDKVVHYIFKSVRGGYNISYTNFDILSGSVRIV